MRILRCCLGAQAALQSYPESPKEPPGSPRELQRASRELPRELPRLLRELPEAVWSSLELTSGLYRFFMSLRVLQDDPGQAKSVENTYIYTCIYKWLPDMGCLQSCIIAL